MKVLVTGSSGFIGKYVQWSLENQGHDVIGFDAADGLSVTSKSDIHEAVFNGRIEAIINLAGVLGTSELFDGGERGAVEANILGALNVYDVARKAEIPVVQIGTGHKGQPNPYAITKGAAEDLGLARAQWLGDKIVVVRAYHVYGAGQKMCAPHGKSPVRKIFPSFACRALTGMDVEINGSGDQLIDLVHAADVAESLVAAIGGPYGTVVEAGTGVATRVGAAAIEIMSECRSTSNIKYLPGREGEPEDAVVVAANPDCPAHPWPWKVRETIDWYRDQLLAKGLL